MLCITGDQVGNGVPVRFRFRALVRKRPVSNSPKASSKHCPKNSHSCLLHVRNDLNRFQTVCRINLGHRDQGTRNAIRFLGQEPHSARQPAWMLNSLIPRAANTAIDTAKNNSVWSIPASVSRPGIHTNFSTTRSKTRGKAKSRSAPFGTHAFFACNSKHRQQFRQPHDVALRGLFADCC